MSNLTGLPQGSIIILAALVFSAAAWTNGMPREPEPKCDDVSVIRYLPAPEPVPIYPTPAIPSVAEIGPPKAEPAAEVQSTVQQEPERRRHRRYRHRRWG